MAESGLKHILYVEDDPDIRTVAKISFEIVGGFELNCCASGMDALQQIRNGYVPDLLLLDVMMPVMDGPTTLFELRKLAPTANTPVVFMTAKVQSVELEYYRNLGALGVIAKPFDPMTLSDQINEMWARRQ